MGGAIAEGLIRSGRADALTVSNPHSDKLERFAQGGASVTTDNQAAAKGADIVMVVVKPWLVETVVSEIKPVIDYGSQTVVIVAAGIPGATITSWLERDGSVPPVVLAMPNIAIAQGESMTFLAPVNARDEQLQPLVTLFDSLGQTLVTDEQHYRAATAVSCSIAYAMRYVRASVEGCVELGFRAGEAEKMVCQIAKGAVSLLQATGEHPEAAIDRVTTPGGWTIRGLNAMERCGFTTAVIEGLKAPLG